MRQHLIWNGGAWFGGLVGLTAWLAVSAVVVGARDLVAAVGPVVGCLVTIAAGVALWRGRGGIAMGRAMLMLLGVGGVCGLGAMVWVHASGQLDALCSMTPGGAPGAWATYGALLVYPALAGLIWWRERASGRGFAEG